MNPRRWYSIGGDYSVGWGSQILTTDLLPAALQAEVNGAAGDIIEQGFLPANYHLAVPTDAFTQTFAFGPQLAFRHYSRLTLFVRPSLGALRERAVPHPADLFQTGIVAQLAPAGYKLDWTGFYGVGGGGGLSISRHFGIRAQMDAVYNHPFNDILANGRWTFRYSVGPSFHFGRNMASRRQCSLPDTAPRNRVSAWSTASPPRRSHQREEVHQPPLGPSPPAVAHPDRRATAPGSPAPPSGPSAAARSPSTASPPKESCCRPRHAAGTPACASVARRPSGESAGNSYACAAIAAAILARVAGREVSIRSSASRFCAVVQQRASPGLALLVLVQMRPQHRAHRLQVRRRHKVLQILVLHAPAARTHAAVSTSTVPSGRTSRPVR